MIKLELSEKQVGVHRGAYDAAVRQLGAELNRLGTPALEQCLSHLGALYEACIALDVAVKDAEKSESAASPKPNGLDHPPAYQHADRHGKADQEPAAESQR